MSSVKGHVLLGGGTGFVGLHLVRLLKNTGYSVKVISRSPRNKSQLSWRDITNHGIPKETTAVINLSGQNILDYKHRWTEDFKRLVWNSRIQTSKILVDGIIANPQKIDTYMGISGTAVYEPCEDKEYSEDSRIHEYDFLSGMCIQLEKTSKFPGEINCRQVIIRSGVVLGREGGMIQNLYLPFSLGLGGPMLPGSQILPWIHVSDLTRLMVFCLDNKKISGIINGVAPKYATNTEFARAFGKALWRPAIFPMPQFMLNLMFEERAKMITEGPKVLPKRAIGLGFKYVYPDIVSACQGVVDSEKITGDV